MAPENKYETNLTSSSYFIVSDKWELYSVQVDFFRKRLKNVEWIVLIEENRMKPFMSVPNHYPVGSEIYTRLYQEQLGFQRVAQFKNHPLFNITTYDKSAEPTLTAFDHPNILIYHRTQNPSPEEVLSALKQDIQNDPKYPDQNILAGVQAFQQKNWEEAKRAFERALQVDPNFALANLLIGEIYIKHNLTDSTQKIWDRLTEQNVNINKYAFLGLINAGLREEGIIYLENVAKTPGEDPNLLLLASRTYTEIALEYQQKNDLQTALANHTKAIALTPDDPEPYLNATFVLIELGDLDNAQTLLDHVQKLQPNMSMALHAQALLYQKQEKLDDAYAALLNALNLDPKNIQHQNVLLGLAGKYYEQGKIEMAYTIFTEILKHDPNFQEAHYNLGVMYIQSGDYQNALSELQKAVQLKPQDPDAQFALAGVYETLGQADLAVEHYHNVLVLMPNYVEAITRLEILTSQ